MCTSVVEGKKPRTENSDKWRPLISSRSTETGKTIPQQTEYIPSHSWDSDGHKNTKRYKNRKKVVQQHVKIASVEAEPSNCSRHFEQSFRVSEENLCVNCFNMKDHELNICGSVHHA